MSTAGENAYNRDRQHPSPHNLTLLFGILGSHGFIIGSRRSERSYKISQCDTIPSPDPDQRERGLQAGLTPKRRGRKVRGKDPREEENERLRRENHKLRQRLQQAEIIIEFQKKLSDLLGIPLTTPPTNESKE